jgi:hypothetical protein
MALLEMQDMQTREHGGGFSSELSVLCFSAASVTIC